ncbi:PAS domain S-box protein [Desulfospira joergensenii]|uniref:PAS domain S-box protein n=1 Tax=Desulfospira joergensenii TaxID=53329 RepID=UPI0003B72004|nr:PAS domain S-box protein [Desulfospira joergensenii]
MRIPIGQNRNINKKVISIVVLGVCACLLSSLLNLYFSTKSRNNQNLLYRIQQLPGKAENIRLMSKNFIQTGDLDLWQKITRNISSLQVNVIDASPANKVWKQKLGNINKRITEYHYLLNQIHYPALLLNREKNKFQRIGLSFSMEVKDRIITPYRKEEGVSIYQGKAFDPFKIRIKETAYDLMALHIQQQLILTELLLDWDLAGYRQKKEQITGAMEQHKTQLNYLNILMGSEPEIDRVINSLKQKLADLVQYEQEIVKTFTELDRINRNLAAAGSRLVDDCSAFSAEILSDISRTGRLNRNLNWALLVVILCGLVSLGALLARDIIRIVRDLEESRENYRSSEKMIKAVTDNVPGVVFQFKSSKDHDYTIEFVSTKISELFGLEPDTERVFHQFSDRIPQEEKEQYLHSIRESIDQVSPWNYEGRFIKPNGEEIWFSGNSAPRREGDSIVSNGLLMDITNRKEMESSMRISQFIFNKAPLGIWRMGPMGEVLDVNEKGCETLGFSREELCRMKVFDFAPGYTMEHWAETTKVLNEAGIKTTEAFHQNKDGKIIPIQVIENLMKFENQEFRVAFVQDITERKKAEESLRIARFSLDNANIAIHRMAPDARILETNQKAAQLLGYTKEEMKNLSVFDIDPAVTREEWDPLWHDLKERGFHLLEREHLRKDGSPIPVEVYGTLLEYEGQQYSIVFIQDITERKQAEKELRQLQNYLSNIINSMPSVLVAVNQEGRVTQWNNRTEQTTGLSFEQALDQPLVKVFPRLAEEMERIRTSIRERRVIRSHKIPLKTDQETRFEDITIFPLVSSGVDGAVIRVDDVTEKVRMEEMMIQSEKMLTVGGLAAGMAHEINNPLAGMLQTASVLARRLGTGDHIPANQKAAETAGIPLEAVELYMKIRDIPRMLDAITASGRRVADIVENMLSFARKEDTKIMPCHLNAVLDKTIELAATDYDMKKEYDFKHIRIVKEYAGDMPAIPCRESKIQQVLLNILINGAQAMQASRIQDPCFILRTYADIDSGMACMEIEDNGPGMDETTRKHVFDPFFTTKQPGLGTGLGLSVSYFIITENHNGEMTVESRPGKGSKFMICLPMHPENRQGH